MIFDVDRLQVLSGIKNNTHDDSPRLVTESADHLAEQRIRQIIREEIKSYLNEQQASSMAKGFHQNDLTTAMGFAGRKVGFSPGPGFHSGEPASTNRAAARGPGRSFGFGGPGFM